MKHIDEALLESFRNKRRCDLCGLPVYNVRPEPHHVYPKGMGSGSRVDIRENIMAVHWKCHRSIEDGNVHREVCWLIVALREKLTVEECKASVMRVINAPKGESDGRRSDVGPLHLRPGVFLPPFTS